MKTKVKETGKWITVNPCNDGFYDVNIHDIYEPDELDFEPDCYRTRRGFISTIKDSKP